MVDGHWALERTSRRGTDEVIGLTGGAGSSTVMNLRRMVMMTKSRPETALVAIWLLGCFALDVSFTACRAVSSESLW